MLKSKQHKVGTQQQQQQKHQAGSTDGTYPLKEVMSMDQVSDALTGQYSQHRLNL